MEMEYRTRIKWFRFNWIRSIRSVLVGRQKDYTQCESFLGSDHDQKRNDNWAVRWQNDTLCGVMRITIAVQNYWTWMRTESDRGVGESDWPSCGFRRKRKSEEEERKVVWCSVKSLWFTNLKTWKLKTWLNPFHTHHWKLVHLVVNLGQVTRHATHFRWFIYYGKKQKEK